MICEKELRKELKTLPKFIKRELKAGNISEALSLQHTLETVEWILQDNCECKR